MYGCDLGADGRRGGHMQYAYDGADYISLDKDTLTWTAASPMAHVFKRKRDADLAYSQHLKVYLEEECVEWLRTFVAYGKEALMAREPPVVRLARQQGHSHQETLVCRAHGFYPKEISTTWRKDGEAWTEGTLHGGVVPNADMTYHTWVSIRINPTERHRYQCHVKHPGLPEPLILAWEEPDSPDWGLLAGVAAAVVAATALLGAGIAFLLKLRRARAEGYKAASTGDQGSDSSVKA